MIRKMSAAAVALATAGLAQGAHAADLTPDQADFRSLYKELLEINTTLSVGSCTAAAEAMAARLKAAGYPDKDIQILAPDDRPKAGNLIAVLHGKDPKAKPILLLAHIDVVEAKREDWERDPFKMVEENGYFYARGASDDKAMAASITDAMIRYKKEGFKPRRDIKLALTCGEETPDTFNGVSWLIKTHPEALSAAFALNEGAGGQVDADGKPVFLGIQAGEKVYQDFQLVTTNPGGHSSRPVKDNAIYHLSAALTRLQNYDFPVAINEATQGHFKEMAAIEGGDTGKALLGALAGDPAAIAEVAKDPSRNSMMRTTCVATMVDAGHAPNALPQRAEANVNCRILPGESVDSVEAKLVQVFDDPKIAVTAVGERSPVTPPPPLTDAIVGPVKTVAAQLWPGLPLVPAMATGATDGRFLNAIGTPTYGLSGMLGDKDGQGVHGLNERIRVKSLYDGREFLYRVVKIYANAKG
ncbi:M20/M25/M40 family metallo-hydrolase [Phenylobacterium sp.]|uniref:M20/M25/M40 family metallo-hydrolase n=1 Tax=Phenylobacterium sp. TaxID=1871053 RepID=UPI0035AFC634